MDEIAAVVTSYQNHSYYYLIFTKHGKIYKCEIEPYTEKFVFKLLGSFNFNQ